MFCHGPPARLTLPTAAAVPALPGPGGSNSVPPSPASTTLLHHHKQLQACCCREQGHGLSRSPHSPRGAAHPGQCPAHTGAAGCVSTGFCSSEKDSNAQESSYCEAKAEPQQCHPPVDRDFEETTQYPPFLQNQCFHPMLRIL